MMNSRLITSPPSGGKALPSSAPQPMDGLQSSAPPPFLTKTFDMVDDSATDSTVSWSSSNNSFVVWNPPEFARDLLPKYFKHNNFSSFVRQLNTYGFRKVDPDRWEFANEGFLRGQRQLLKNIHRRKPVAHSQPQQQQQSQSSTVGPCVEVGKFGLEGEIERLKRDKNVLMLELVRLRQQQQATERNVQVMGQRLQVAEQRQQQMMSFLAKAMQNPAFLAQLVQQTETSKRLAATVRKKRRLPKQEVDGDSSDPGSPPDGQIVKYLPSSNDALAVFMQLFSSAEGTKVDVGNPLEALFRELGSSGDPMQESRHSGVTLTEMHAPSPRQECLANQAAPDFVSDSGLHMTPTSPPTPQSAANQVNGGHRMGSPDLEVDPFEEDIGDGSLKLREPNGDVMSLELGTSGQVDRQSPEAETSTTADSAPVSSSVNDIFWEQFLTASSAESPGSEQEGDDIQDPIDHGDIQGGDTWLYGVPVVDQLAEQMGQLAPGVKL